jgi:hypothetical protein
MGAYRMDAPAKGPLALLKRLRGSTRPKPGGSANSGAGQMRMLRRLPKILRFIPGTAQDVRAYFLTLQYWLAGSDDNVIAMVCSLIDRYAAGPREPRRGKTPAAPPCVYPELGVYHPRTTQRMSESLALLPPAKGPRGTVGCCCCAPTCWATMPGITTADRRDGSGRAARDPGLFQRSGCPRRDGALFPSRWRGGGGRHRQRHRLFARRWPGLQRSGAAVETLAGFVCLHRRPRRGIPDDRGMARAAPGWCRSSHDDGRPARTRRRDLPQRVRWPQRGAVDPKRH